MDYVKEYKSFVNSQYLSEGVRMTVGIALPAIILNYFDLLSVGIVVALGAMSVAITDNAGPVVHRKNGMSACVIIIFIVSLLTGLAAPHAFWLAVLIVVSCFIFSMISVFGNRANSIGVSALLIMILNIDRIHVGWDVVVNALYILAGGAWYMLLSLLLYRIRPYRLVQQALGECIQSTADYLRVRASFYEKEVDYEETYQRMLQQQVTVHEKQNLVRELLFKTRSIIRESTNTGRMLVMIFVDMVDLFERAMTSYQDYKALHNYFGEFDILEKYHSLIIELCNELDEIGIAIKSGKPSEESELLQQHVKDVHDYFETFRDAHRNAENVDGFISLRHILNSLEDIAARIHTLHLYSTYDKKLVKEFSRPVDYDKFISHQPIEIKLLWDNFSLQSNYFRHALRVSIATLAGYIISMFFPLGHSYWILLTIIVILKPAYSLTRRRNYERLIGTIGGAIIGFLILYFIKDVHVLFAIMLLLMVGTYSLIRTKYMYSIIFMTPYILVLFHLLSSTNFENILSDRVIDTVIGSAIAFIANLLILPAWEHEQIKSYMQKIITENKNYFVDISQAFIDKPVATTQYKLSRKNAFVALANLSDAFTRMLAEPKSKQKNARAMHQFVVLNTMLTSHIATLSYYVKNFAQQYRSNDFVPAVDATVLNLDEANAIISAGISEEKQKDEKQRNNIVDKKVQKLLLQRRNELQQGITESDTRKTLSEFKPIADQFNFIVNISGDLKRVSEELTKE